MNNINIYSLYVDKSQNPTKYLTSLISQETDTDTQIAILFKQYQQANTIRIISYDPITNEIDTNQIIANRK